MSAPAEAVLGVDGCPGGWLGARVEDGAVEWLLLPTAAAVLAVRSAAVGIDIPIGLPDAGPRGCDLAARRLLRPRGSVVFPAPVRSVLGVASYAEACRRSRATQGIALSRQVFNLLEKIADVDAGMVPARQRTLVEVHPEASFALLTGRVLAPKKTPTGRSERAAALAGWLPDVARSVAAAPRPARPDDALDALAAAWSARRWLTGAAVVLPGSPERDARGLRMEIVA